MSCRASAGRSSSRRTDGGADEVAALRDFLSNGRVNQKWDDAPLLLRTLRDQAESGFGAKVVNFKFETTEFWCRAQRAAGEFSSTDQLDA